MYNVRKISRWIFFPALIIVLSVISIGSGNYQALHNSSNSSIIEGELLLTIEKDANINSILHSINPDAVFSTELISQELNLWLIKQTKGENDSPTQLLSRFESHPKIKNVQLNHIVTLRENAPDDPRFEEQWGLKNTGQHGGTPNADIKALKAWDITTGGFTKDGEEIVVAVIDNGFYLDHTELNFKKNLNEIPANKIDDDRNGYVDDYNGWNVISGNDSILSFDHGTRVCGIIGAKGNNNAGITGVNWKVSILPVQIKAHPEIDEASVLKAYSYVLRQRRIYNISNGENGCFIVAANTSFGIDFGKPEDHPIWCEFFDYMGKEGILNVAATMNNSSNVDITGDIPTTCPSDYLISVTSTTPQDELFGGAAYGPRSIDVGAPGINVLSTIPGNFYSMSGGTSLAAPHVSGTIALIYSGAHQSYLDYGNIHPDSLALKIKRYLLEGTDKLPSLQGKLLSGGRLNLFNPVIRIDRPMNLEGQVIPTTYTLSQNYPNPFNPSTRITYDILDPVNVKIIVYNGLGQKISKIVDSFHTKGRYSIQFNAEALPAGIYYYKIQSKYFSEVKKMVLLK
jgi:subtilisin family serine protease